MSQRTTTNLPFEMVFLLPCGKKQTREFKTERETAEYLKATYTAEAPISFTYNDGAVVDFRIIERIYATVFKSGTEKRQGGSESFPAMTKGQETRLTNLLRKQGSEYVLNGRETKELLRLQRLLSLRAEKISPASAFPRPRLLVASVVPLQN